MLMDSLFGSPHCQHPFSLDSFTNCQRVNIKGLFIDSNNKSYRAFPSFSPTHLELSLGLRIIDTFSDCFSFNLCNKEKNDKLHI